MKPLFRSPLIALTLIAGALDANGQCPNCGPQRGSTPEPPAPSSGNSGGGGSGTFKGKSAKLPTVTSVSKDTLVIGTKTYSLDSAVRITVDGKTATLADIKPGMRVLVNAKKVPVDIYRAWSISARTIK